MGPESAGRDWGMSKCHLPISSRRFAAGEDPPDRIHLTTGCATTTGGMRFRRKDTLFSPLIIDHYMEGPW
jgi:hypothetical protein